MSDPRRRWMEDIKDTLDEQCFRWETLADGHSIRVYPKMPGQALVMINTGTDRTAQLNTISRLRRIGVYIPHKNEKPKQPPEPSMPNPLTPAAVKANGHAPQDDAPKPLNPFDQVRKHIDEALNSLAAASEVLADVERGQAKLHQLRDLLREAL